MPRARSALRVVRTTHGGRAWWREPQLGTARSVAGAAEGDLLLVPTALRALLTNEGLLNRGVACFQRLPWTGCAHEFGAARRQTGDLGQDIR